MDLVTSISIFMGLWYHGHKPKMQTINIRETFWALIQYKDVILPV